MTGEPIILEETPHGQWCPPKQSRLLDDLTNGPIELTR